MSAKNLDQKGRWRNKVVAFRCSPEEDEIIETRAKLCGCRTKQDYILGCLLNEKLDVHGNPWMMVQFQKNLEHIEKELERINSLEEVDEEFFTPIKTMLEILEGFKTKKES